MVKYIFKLNQKYEPDLTQTKEKDNIYDGIRLIYTAYKIYYVSLFGREIPLFLTILGKKTFLRPYKKVWDKRTYRLPYVYWGKKTHPLTRLWVVIPNNYPLGKNRIVPEVNLIHQHVKLFGHTFLSKDITKNLFGCKDKFQLKSIN
jgi:hypothetical protein